MGVGALIRSQNDEKKEALTNFKTARLFSSLNDFTALAFESGPKNDALRSLLENEASRMALIEFLHTDEKCRQFLSDGDLNTKAINTNETLSCYELPENEVDISANCIHSIASYQHSLFETGLKSYSESINKETNELFGSCSNETLLIMALAILPKFLKSVQFQNWRQNETKRAIEVANNTIRNPTTIPDILPLSELQYGNPNYTVAQAEISNNNNNNNSMKYSTHSSSLCPIIQTENKYSDSKDIPLTNTSKNTALPDAVAITLSESEQSKNEDLEQLLHTVDYLEIERILEYGSWLFAFIAAVENIPVCITLSTARKDRLGFPLIYVNRYFEYTTGHDRTSIMGASCRFLQRNRQGVAVTELDSVQRISQALHHAESSRVAITNYKRCGTPFRNLLAIKPVFDMNGEYQFVIGVQFDLSSIKANAYALRMTDNLMKMLPDVAVT